MWRTTEDSSVTQTQQVNVSGDGRIRQRQRTLRWREGQGLLDYRPVGLDINMTGHTVTLRPWVRYTARWGHGGVPRVELKPSGPGSSHSKTRLMNAGAVATPANWVLIRSGLCEHCVSNVYVKKSLPGHRQGGVWILSDLPRLHTCPLQGCGTEKADRFWHCDEVAFSLRAWIMWHTSFHPPLCQHAGDTQKVVHETVNPSEIYPSKPSQHRWDQQWQRWQQESVRAGSAPKFFFF